MAQPPSTPEMTKEEKKAAQRAAYRMAVWISAMADEHDFDWDETTAEEREITAIIAEGLAEACAQREQRIGKLEAALLERSMDYHNAAWIAKRHGDYRAQWEDCADAPCARDRALLAPHEEEAHGA